MQNRNINFNLISKIFRPTQIFQANLSSDQNLLKEPEILLFLSKLSDYAKGEIEEISPYLEIGSGGKKDYPLYFLLRNISIFYQQYLKKLPEIPTRTRLDSKGLSLFPFIELVFIALSKFDKKYEKPIEYLYCTDKNINNTGRNIICDELSDNVDESKITGILDKLKEINSKELRI